MGTNYYAVENRCATCGRGDAPIHIGKSGSTLRGYRPDSAGPKPDVPIGSWAEWKAWLTTADVRVEDEYGGTWATGDLIDYFEKTPMTERRRQYDWMVRHIPQKTQGPDPTDVLEPDGFSLCFGEFS